MTGLHGLHVLLGLFVLSAMLLLISKGKISQDHFVPLENSGLYWHLVDIIWIFLFPLFYLIT
jgi:cytochrome c oxidase subunit 3